MVATQISQRLTMQFIFTHTGITRFLVLDVKKPDYALIRQQLETAYGSQLADTSNLATGDQQWNSRVFGKCFHLDPLTMANKVSFFILVRLNG